MNFLSSKTLPQIDRRTALASSFAAATFIGTGTPALSFSETPSYQAPMRALGIGLEDWPYPGEVRFHPLVMEGEAVRMAYMDFAPTSTPNGRSIVLLHGKNFDSSYWTAPIDWLRAAGFRVVVPDQIGFNKSSKPALAYTFEGLARNTLDLIGELKIGRFSMLGHSTGGALAVRIASMVPERIEQLALEDPIGLIDYRSFISPQETSTLVSAEHAYSAESYRKFIGHFFPLLDAKEYEPFVTWRMRVSLSGEFDRFARASALTYQMIYREPVRPLYSLLTMPVLLTAGTADRSAPLVGYATPEARARMPGIHEAAQSAVGDLIHGQFVSFPQVGHVPHMERPEHFREALLRFLAP
ncbi:alpha/beta hydrolase [Novosphingobium profundi]|uniref:alpha/beta fold hydrolase n=1 Tax=Novosphingobium profundi TaxID=1774954 RepID=UPI001BDB02D8|nr:alpha/beta hydrolase [Novosphingobium profundi]MBT0667435.1 alpha/beta hydrolase [Novosphingobium profundi]